MALGRSIAVASSCKMDHRGNANAEVDLGGEQPCVLERAREKRARRHPSSPRQTTLSLTADAEEEQEVGLLPCVLAGSAAVAGIGSCGLL